VATILVRPSWPGEEHVRSRFAQSLHELGAGPYPFPGLDGDAGAAVASMERVLRSALTVLARRNGLNDATGEFAELLAWHRGWLAFLLACRNDLRTTWEHFTPPARGVTAIVDGPIGVSVPGLQHEAYKVVRMPWRGPESGITAELADAVLAQFAGPSTLPGPSPSSGSAAHRNPLAQETQCHPDSGPLGFLISGSSTR